MQKNTFWKWCLGRCGKNHKQCLKANGVDWHSNKVEMEILAHRNITPLFSTRGRERLRISGGWSYAKLKGAY